MNSKNNKYDQNSTLEQVLNHSRGEEILQQFKVPCLGCPMAQLEMEQLTLGQICEMYDLPLEDILKQLNK